MKELNRNGEAAKNRVFKLAGISETSVRNMIDSIAVGENARIFCLSGSGEIQVTITVKNDTKYSELLLDTVSEKLKERLKNHIFCCDGEVIEDIIGRLLILRRLTIAFAESCTGGLISARLTNTPGSSEYFKGGVVSYSNELKEKFLGVPADILELHGAVSQETASAMAEGIRNRASSDIGLSVTGIAGPGGDTPDKPLGLVYIGLSSASGVLYWKYIFPGNRNGVRQGTVNMALNIIRRFLEQDNS